MEKYSKNQFHMALLPNNFKKIGIFIAAVSLLTQISFIVIVQTLSQSQIELIKLVSRSLFTIGLFFFAYSKEKIEDEMNYYIRIKSMALTLLFVIVSGILSPFLSYIFNDIPSIKTNQGFVITVILEYIFIYHIQKMMKK